MQSLSIDFETRSTINLKDTGVYPYARHPETDIWCMAWAFGDEEPELWTPDAVEHVEDDCSIMLFGVCDCAVRSGLPRRVVEHIAAGGEIRAWNAAFERQIWNEIMVKRYGAPNVALEQWVCTAAEAAAMALPRSLDECARVTKVTMQKDKEGYNLMLRMCRPRSIADDGTLVWWDTPDKLAVLYPYCKQDVRTEVSLAKVLRRLTPRERQLYVLNERMNDRGIGLDRELVVAAMAIVAEGVKRANADLADLTDGMVTTVTKVAQLKEWMSLYGVVVESLDKAHVAELLEQELPPAVRKAIELRADAGRSSVKKLDTMLDVLCDDARLHGLVLYHAAGTGRFGGRLVQPQNFPRGEVKNPEQYIPLILAGDYDTLSLFEHPIVIVVALLRSMLRAALGRKFLTADFSAIEARVLNWIAQEQSVLDAFRQYDRARAADKPKFDPYRRQAVAMGRGERPELVTKEDRQAGKAAELGCGFQMGWKKFIKAAWDVYQVRVTEEQSKIAVKAYRETHPNVKQLWKDANDACIAAVRDPGTVQTFGPLGNMKFTKRGGFLYLILPSKRPLCFASPRLVLKPAPWDEHQMLESVEVWGIDSQTNKWLPYLLYGGIIVNNVVQATARDLMAEAMFRAEERGFPVVLTVHDEVVTEPEAGHGTVEEFEALLRELPTWAAGCPVNAEGWQGDRYRK